MFDRFFRKSRNRPLIDALHGEIVAASRQKVFFTDYGVPDNFEGRFEVVSLNAGLLLRRLQECDEPGPQIAQDLVDRLFLGFDGALRESGVGDLAVARKMNALAEAFLGRNQAYAAALTAGEPGALEAALARNIAATPPAPQRLAAYVRAAAAGLKALQLEDVMKGAGLFPDAGTLTSPEEVRP
ncbi:MAG: ubiquinol-cytochrome c chaperone [Hyphomicrobiales bacterium]|nr:ubiquinol-cytochrome c chaperone [Hyphomicrobiales bacterium]